MRRIIFLLFLPTLAAQTADRTLPASQEQPGLVVRLLEPFRPSDPKPQTGREKFHDYVSSTVGVIPLLGEAANAAITFGLDRPPEWGQGMKGYGKRLGNNLAYNAIRTSVTYPTAVLFHEDNRYFGSGKRNFAGRVAFALTSPFRARRPSGHYSFSFSTTTGIVAANAATYAWAPPSWRGPANVAGNLGLSYAGIAGLNVFREFVPDLIGHFRH